jgi:hypothetical protein
MYFFFLQVKILTITQLQIEQLTLVRVRPCVCAGRKLEGLAIKKHVGVASWLRCRHIDWLHSLARVRKCGL